MDFLFSSSKKEKDGIYNVNLTVIIYESDLHHCLLEYKIYFEEESFVNNNNKRQQRLKRFLKAELIGDSLIIF